jgi:uncharacterized protein
MVDVFISYASSEREQIRQLADALKRLQLEIWYDQQIQVGELFDDEIDQKLKEARCVIVCWSHASVESKWVMREATVADLQNTIAPIFLDDVAPPAPFARREGARLSGWIGEPDHPEWLLLLRRVESLAGRSGLINQENARAHSSKAIQVRHYRADRERRGRRRILSLDGAGVRIFIQLGFLERMEHILASRSFNPAQFRLATYFDLIGGTSMGALVAALLAMGHSVEQTRAILVDLIPQCYPTEGWFRRGRTAIDRMSDALERCFADMTLGSDRIQTGLAFCMNLVSAGTTWVLTNNSFNRYFHHADSPNSAIWVRDLLAACIATPGQIAPRRVRLDRYREILAIDGVYGGLANPSLQLLLAAASPAHGLRWQLGPDRLMIISVGAGIWRGRIDLVDASRMRGGALSTRVAQGFALNTIKETTLLMQSLAETARDWSIESTGEVMDLSRLTLAPLFRYQRYDCDLTLYSDPNKCKEIGVTQSEIRELSQFGEPCGNRFIVAASKLGRCRSQIDMRGDDFPPMFDIQYEPV